MTDYQPGLEMLIELGVEDRILGRAAFEENVGEPDEFLPGHKAVYDSLREVSDGYFPVLIADPAGETFYAMGSGMGTQILEAAGAVETIAQDLHPEAFE